MSTFEEIKTQDSRRVRFAYQPQYREVDRHAQDKDELWVSKDECDKYKEICLRSGQHWKRKGCDVLLNDCYQKPTSGTQSKLNAFAALPEELGCIPRGIERFISTKHAEERRYAKVHCIESVVDMCTYMTRQYRAWEEIEAELQKLSIKQSKRSRDFARRIAEADARAVREEVEEVAAAPVPLEIRISDDKPKKGLSSRAIEGSRRLSRMITGSKQEGQR